MPSKRYVKLCDGRRIGLGAYVKAWRACLGLPGNTHIGKGVDGWGQTASEALSDLRRGMDDRINRHIPGYGKGRKWDSDWFWSAWRAARDVNTPRLVVRYVPMEFRARLAHRIET